MTGCSSADKTGTEVGTDLTDKTEYALDYTDTASPDDIAATEGYDDPGGGVASVEASQGLRNGRMPRILGKVDLFEEHEVEDAKEVVLEYGCCDEEFPTSLETIESHETVGDALQSQPYVDC